MTANKEIKTIGVLTSGEEAGAVKECKDRRETSRQSVRKVWP